MNSFILQGKLLYKEPPKREGGSALIVMAIGKHKEETDNLIQFVNKVIVRVPGRLTQVIARYDEGEYLEISGTMLGRVRYSVGVSKQPMATLNLVAGGIQPCSVSHLVPEKRIAGMLFSSFTMSGLVKSVVPPKKEGRPHTLFLQIERPIGRNEEVQEQPTAVVPISVFNHALGSLSKLEAQMSVVATGDISGVLRKMPMPEMPGEYEERLEVGLSLGYAKQCAIIPTKIFESRQERRERKLREKEEGTKEALADEADVEDETELATEGDE